VALQSPIDTFADDLFSVHMVQHVLISFVVAPLLVLGAPMTLLLLVTGILYWLPAIGLEPMPWRLSWSMRLLYLFVGMPFGSLLGLVLYSQSFVLYPHYLLRLGSDALADQRMAGTIMWVGADLLSMIAIGALVLAWARAEAGQVPAPRRADVRRG
jgi:putative copper resistance protein D